MIFLGINPCANHRLRNVQTSILLWLFVFVYVQVYTWQCIYVVLCVRQYLHVCFKAVIEAVPSSPSLVADIQSLVISRGTLLYAVLALAMGVANSGAGGARKTGEGL